MTKQFTRRTVVATAAMIAGSGCLDSGPATKSDPPTFGSRPVLKDDTVTDIILYAPPDEPVEVTVSAGSWSQELELDADERWTSPDIIGPDETSTVRIETGGESLRIDWPPEGNSQQVLDVYIDQLDIPIYASLDTKGGKIKTKQVTNRSTTPTPE